MSRWLLMLVLSLVAASVQADAYCQGYRQGYVSGYAAAARLPGLPEGVPTCPVNPGIAPGGPFAAGEAAGVQQGGLDHDYWIFRVTSPQGNSTRTLDDPRRALPSSNVYSATTPNAQKPYPDY